MIDIKVTFQESFRTKTNPILYTEAMQETLEYTLTELNNAIKNEAPVRTGNLRDGHNFTITNNLEGAITNNVDYAKYVIYGTSRQSPNNYPQRAINRMNLTGTVTSRLKDSLK